MRKAALKLPVMWETLIKSDTGMFLLVINLIGMGWWALIHSRPIPDGFGFIIVGIWGAKTAHGIFAPEE
jgi:hypothetical protein